MFYFGDFSLLYLLVIVGILLLPAIGSILAKVIATLFSCLSQLGFALFYWFIHIIVAILGPIYSAYVYIKRKIQQSKKVG